jgi:hypothetical protein
MARMAKSTRLARWVALATMAALLPLLGVTPRAAALPIGCDWPVTLGYDGLNLLAPDTQASYWLLHYEAVPGTSLRIEGRYPRARFFSHTIQDETEVTVAALVDQDIAPVPGSTNPFRPHASATGPHRYAIRIAFSDPPAGGPERNTLYAGSTYEGEPNPGGTVVYRVYVPTDQHDVQGGVPLPRVVWETPLGDIDLSFDACTPLLGGLGGPANSTTEGANRPGDLPGLVPVSKDYARVPDFVRLHEGGFTDPVVNSLPDQVADAVPHRGGTPLANAPFPYLRSSITRQFGKTVVIRFKAPSFPDTVHGEPVTVARQTRYWSLCSYAATEDTLLRGSGCLTDFRTATDSRGRVTVVVADPAHRPAHTVDRAGGVHWLPWGPYDKDFLLFRFGLPATSWKYSPLRITPEATDQAAAAARVMGAYYPVARYCSKEQIERRGVASCFRH